MELTPTQLAAIAADQTSFLLGPAGTGKTTILQHRLIRLLESGEPAYTMLVLVAEPEHQSPFLDTVHQSGLGPYTDLEITTYNSMAREMVSLFWPLVARPARFERPFQPPKFLSYDLAQLLMWRVITPMLAQGAFADLRLRPQQIVSQLLDTLNRAALNGLTLDEAAERQMVTWVGEADHLRHLGDAATAARRFREFCRQNSLLDLSLTVRVFDTELVHHPEFRRYFSERYRHLLVDNVEEQTPAGQNFVASLMDETQTTAIAYDAGGGYKRFLAADPTGANQFHSRSKHVFTFEESDSFTAPLHMFHLANLVENDLMRTAKPAVEAETAIIGMVGGRYRREMVNNLIPVLSDLMEQGVAPGEIALIAPYLDGANQFHSRSKHVFTFEESDSFTAPLHMFHLANLVENDLMRTNKTAVEAETAIIGMVGGRYRREMVNNLIPVLSDLMEQGVAPGEIALIAPYLDGALRFNLTQALRANRIPYYLLRRRYSPREEPRVRAWLTWLAVAHPLWDIHPSPYDVAEALTLSIADLDPARAALLTERLYRPEDPSLLPASELPERLIERIGPRMVSLFDELRTWLEQQSGREPVDVFLHRLFNNLLAQRRFQPDPNLAGAAVAEWLVRSAGRLRQTAGAMGLRTPAEIGEMFINGIYQGLVTADPPELGDPPDPNGVMISTIYGYLLAGKPVKVQVWLETAATGWWDIPRQPLSNAFVLAQSWRPERPWTMEEDFAIRNQLLSRIVRGLAARCQDGIVLANSDLDRRGLRQDGPLWRALQPVRDQRLALPE